MPRSRSVSPPPSGRAGHAPVGLLAAMTGVALVVMALAHRGAPLVAQDPAPTFAKDVAPILYKNCASCHHPGGIGPFSVLDYDTVVSRVRKIGPAVRGGYMPPWHAEAPRGTFVNDRRLSDADKTTILRWIAGGAKLGDPKALPPRPVFASGWEIGEPDAVVAMPEDYVVPAHGTIEYQYFQVPTNFTEDKWVQAIEILPGTRDVVHHVLVYARPPEAPAATSGAARSSGATSGAARPTPVLAFDDNMKTDDVPRVDSRNAPPERVGNLIGTTAPGTNVLRLPEGTALRIRAGSVLTFQMHYTAHGHETKDRTSVGFRFAKEPPAEQVIASNFFNGQFVLPPGAKDVMVPSTLGFNEPIRIYGLFPHTHVRGTRWQYTLEMPDGSSSVILDVPRYDFNWQTYYLFASPLEIPAGARIVSRAWYDNSATNPDNPDPSVAVRWGDQTWQEMQYTGILYTVNSRRLRPAPR